MVRLWITSFSIVIKRNITGKRPSTGAANTFLRNNLQAATLCDVAIVIAQGIMKE